MRLERIKDIGQISQMAVCISQFAFWLRDKTQSRWKWFAGFLCFFEIDLFKPENVRPVRRNQGADADSRKTLN